MPAARRENREGFPKMVPDVLNVREFSDTTHEVRFGGNPKCFKPVGCQAYQNIWFEESRETFALCRVWWVVSFRTMRGEVFFQSG